MKKIIYSIVCCIILVASLCAQPQKIPYLGDKPGTFEILSRTNYSTYIKFTQAEMAANMERIKELEQKWIKKIGNQYQISPDILLAI